MDEQEIKADIKEVKTLVLDLVKQGAVHNELLRTHEGRSLALQANQDKLDLRFNPIETHVHFVNLVLKGAGLIFTGSVVGLLVQAIARLANRV